MAMRTRLKLKPGQNGTKKLLEKYGDVLVCVRYRYDEETQKRYKTVELIVDEGVWHQQPERQKAAKERAGRQKAAKQKLLSATAPQDGLSQDLPKSSAPAEAPAPALTTPATTSALGATATALDVSNETGALDALMTTGLLAPERAAENADEPDLAEAAERFDAFATLSEDGDLQTTDLTPPVLKDLLESSEPEPLFGNPVQGASAIPPFKRSEEPSAAEVSGGTPMRNIGKNSFSETGVPLSRTLASRFVEHFHQSVDLQFAFGAMSTVELGRIHEKLFDLLLGDLSPSPDALSAFKFTAEQLELIEQRFAESCFDLSLPEETLLKVLRRIDQHRQLLTKTVIELPARMTIRLSKAEQWVSILIKNMETMHIRNLSVGVLKAGTHTIEWDKRDNAGKPFPKGAYTVDMFVNGQLVKSIPGKI